jgi:2-phospho-L-lactate guanylyltransferase
MCLFPADIPLVSESEFQQIANDHASHQGLTIVPSHDFKGTNCMLLSPPNILPFCFGMNSYAEHIRQGIKLNLSCQSKHFHGIALDIDNPDDLKTLVVATQKTQSISYLRKIEIGLRFN